MSKKEDNLEIQLINELKKVNRKIDTLEEKLNRKISSLRREIELMEISQQKTPSFFNTIPLYKPRLRAGSVYGYERDDD